jgi:hypothetical protein
MVDSQHTGNFFNLWSPAWLSTTPVALQVVSCDHAARPVLFKVRFDDGDGEEYERRELEPLLLAPAQVAEERASAAMTLEVCSPSGREFQVC